MIETVFNSADVPAEDRFDYWRECRSRTHAPVDMSSPHALDYQACQRTLHLGALTASALTFQPVVLRRTPKLIRHSDPEVYHVSLILHGTGGAAWDDHDRTYHRYDIATQSSSRPCTMWVDDGQDALTMVGVEIPHALLPLPRDKAEQVIGRPLSGRNGIGALLAGFLTRLASESASCQDSDGPRLGTVVADLVSALFAHTLDADRALPPDIHRRTLLLRIRAFIDHRLPDDGLSPATIAAAHHISVSYLHRLFHTDGMSVMSWIRQQRLERARHDLADPALCGMPVYQIAARWGFPHYSVFTRAFHSRYGATPTDYRHQNTHTRAHDRSKIVYASVT